MSIPHVGQLDTKPRCPTCRIMLDGFAQAGGDRPLMPKSGDVTLCVYCQDVLEFQANGFRRLTDAEIAFLPDETRNMLIQAKAITAQLRRR